LGAGLLIDTLDRLAHVVRRPQDHSLASYAPKLKKEDGRLDWNFAAQEISRRVRAFAPWPSVFCRLQGRQVKILEGRLSTGPSQSAQLPGTISDITREGIIVRCGQGSYLITRLQLENRNPLPAYEFSLGARLHPGHRFDL
jgi:methionyl-tRNA formyltransferase